MKIGHPRTGAHKRRPHEPFSSGVARRDRLHYFAALGGYCALTLLLFAGMLPHFTTAIPGGLVATVDGWQNVWNLWWVRHALASGQSPFVTPLLFYPQGASLYLQTLGITNDILVLPVTTLWGPVAGYNTALLLAMILSGLAGYGLALRVGKHRLVAFIAGLIFTCTPYHLTRIWDGQLELASLQWPALYVLFLLRAVEDGRRRDAVLAGVLLALTGLTSWYYLVFAALMSLGVGLLWSPPIAPRSPDQPMQPSWSRLASQAGIVGLVAALVLLPVFVPAIASATNQGEVYQPESAEVVARSANLLDFWLPSYLHPIWGQAVFRSVGSAWHNYSGDWNAALGYTVVALVVVGALTRWQSAWRWLALAGGMLLLALGPELQIGDWKTGLPLPYALLDLLPGLSLGRRPALFVAAATILLIPPVTLGLTSLSTMLRSREHPLRWIVPLAIIAIELIPGPWPLLPNAVHPAYQSLRDGMGAILEVPPAAYKYVEPQRAQMIHGRPILGGYLARPLRYQWPNLMPAIRPLWKMRPELESPFLEGSDGPLAALSAYGIGDIVVRWDQIEPGRRAAVSEALAQALPGVAATYTDDTLAIYHVPVVKPQPVAALSGEGWQRSEGDGTARWRWMGEEGAIVLINPADTPRQMTLLLGAQSFQRPREVTFALDGAPAGSWSVQLAPGQIVLHLLIPPGIHELTLQAEADREPVANSERLLSIALREARLISNEP